MFVCMYCRMNDQPIQFDPTFEFVQNKKRKIEEKAKKRHEEAKPSIFKDMQGSNDCTCGCCDVNDKSRFNYCCRYFFRFSENLTTVGGQFQAKLVKNFALDHQEGICITESPKFKKYVDHEASDLCIV